jgi:NAD+ synthase (glutamine-hydrolysing)
MKLALVPVNVRVGDFEGNLKIHRLAIEEAVKQGASFVVFPELSLLGYPPRDLLHRPDFPELALQQLDSLHEWLKEKYPKLAVVVGTCLRAEAKCISPRGLINAAVFLAGEKREVRAKTLIPFYDVFFESRYFDSAETLPASYRAPVEWEKEKIGLLICEDSWHVMELHGKKLHQQNPTEFLLKQGATLLVNLSASPFDRTKKAKRRETIASAAKASGVPIFYVNHYGAQDEILFDGDAFAFGKDGALLAGKEEASLEPLFLRLDASPKAAKKIATAEMRDLRLILVAGIRDYAKKNGFNRFVLGLSGGIDSALVATLACEALGPERVIGLAMPSKFSSHHSIEDAEELARNLGLTLRHFPIKMPHSTFTMALKPFFEGLAEDVTEENLQSRLRGVAVMAFANKFKALALATGNKSEFAMGYSTLYGDMCGALAPIGDLYKTEVYELSRFLNEERPVIPERSLTKAPSAELKPNQTDQDSLPPYDLLDAALRLLVEEELSLSEALPALKKAFPKAEMALLERIQGALKLNEYKRKQAPPILRVSKKAFGPGRAYPLTCSF